MKSDQALWEDELAHTQFDPAAQRWIPARRGPLQRLLRLLTRIVRP